MLHVDEIHLDHITRPMFVFILHTDHKQLWPYKQMLTIIKVKVKFSLEQTTKAQRWSRGIALFFLDHGTRRG